MPLSAKLTVADNNILTGKPVQVVCNVAGYGSTCVVSIQPILFPNNSAATFGTPVFGNTLALQAAQDVINIPFSLVFHAPSRRQANQEGDGKHLLGAFIQMSDGTTCVAPTLPLLLAQAGEYPVGGVVGKGQLRFDGDVNGAAMNGSLLALIPGAVL